MPYIIRNGVQYASGLDQTTYRKIGSEPLDTQAQDLSGAINEHEDDITEIKSSFSQLLQHTDITGTTTASGALAIPAELFDVAIIDPHYIDSNVGLVFRRDRGYLTCCDNNRYTLANVSVKVRVYYINI